MHGTILIAGAMAQVPRNGGLTWLYLQFLLGFRRLGWDALFIDRLEPEMCIDGAGKATTLEASLNLPYFLSVMRRFGLQDSFALIFNRAELVIGLSREELQQRVANAELLLNVMGYLNDVDLLARTRRRVFVDIDPGFGQMWREMGLHDAFQGHDDFVTLGKSIGQRECAIPTCGLNWITMSHPVVLEHWPEQPPKTNGAYTSIGAWRGPNAPIEYQGRTYGLRAHEFRKFVELPSHCPGSRFEMAFEIHPNDEKDISALTSNDWRIVDPQTVGGSAEDYRAYIAGSKAEFMVPKQIYAETSSGLLSDRSAYYLASGRPVLARETGFSRWYPTGQGLLPFSTLEEAAAGVAEINGNYAHHAKAARSIACEHFDSDKVLKKLLYDLGVA